jgi:hypothetical protein
LIKPVTYQGVFNFKANLYALEVKSRFIDQSKADGYYKGYGDELAATIVGQSIQIGTGAFVVQGRMNEVTAAETVTPKMTNGYVGYVVARIETYHPSDEENCSFVAYVGTSLDAIPLTKDDIYDAEAETVNKVYELPIYSFAISGGAITNLQKLIGAVEDYAKINQIVTSALSTAQTALTTAQEAEKKAQSAVNTAAGAVETAEAADSKADTAVSTANTAKSTAEAAAQTVQQEHEEMTAEINELREDIAEGQGTIVERGGEMLTRYPVDNVVETTDTITIEGGDV